MALQPLIAPTITTVGNGAVASVKVADFDYTFSDGSRITEACWRFTATPGAGARLLSMSVRCVIRGMSSFDASDYDLQNTAQKAIQSVYSSYWFEPIQGETPDQSNEYWVVSGWGVQPVINLTAFKNIYTAEFEVVARFSGTNLILRDPAQGNTILHASAAHGNIIMRDA